MSFGFGSFGSGSRVGKTAVVIAPHDATTASKRNADVVLDGHADQIKINNTIAKLCVNPRAVFGNWKIAPLEFTEGTIKQNGPILVRDSLKVSGTGCSTIFFLENGSNCHMFTHAGYDANETIFKLRLKDFLIDGNHANNLTGECTGILLKPQEYLFTGLWVTNCYRGLKLYGENTYGGFMDKCFIQNNFNYGLGLGGDSIVVNCGIGGNGNDPTQEYTYGACGVFLAGWNSQFSTCHFASNRTDIFGNYAAYNQVQTCVFEAGLGENIRLEGRAWGWTISGNRFGGRRSSQSTGAMPSIAFRYIDAGEKAYGNSISNNSFTVFEGSDIGYSNCILETANCDYNKINNNIFYKGYSLSEPVVKVGANTQVNDNMN